MSSGRGDRYLRTVAAKLGVLKCGKRTGTKTLARWPLFGKAEQRIEVPALTWAKKSPTATR